MNYQSIIDCLVNREFKKAEKLSVNALGMNMLDAQLWLYLAESLAFQGYGASAIAAFNRAWLLDPEAVWVEQAREDLMKSDLARSKEEIENLLKVSDVSVTAALIVKNEAEHIENCLRRIVDNVDEIIIVDTGSTDRTIEIAKRIPKVKIINFTWCDDFSAARNAAFPYITSDWVIWIDADEYLYEEDSEAIKEVAGIFNAVTAPLLIRVGIMCQDDDGSIFGKYGVTRMFRMKDNFRFFGRIHEQAVFSGKDIYEKENTYSTAVRIRLLHHGYKLSVLQEKKKLDRNIKLLEKMVEENADDPAWLFFYGRELFSDERFDESLEILNKCEREADKYQAFGRLLDVYTMMAKIYISKNDYVNAEEVCKKALSQRPDFPDILYLLSVINVDKGYNLLKAAEECAIQSKKSFERYRDTVSPDYSILEWKADLLQADIALYQGKAAEAEILYQKVLKVIKLSPVKEGIQKKIEFINKEREKIN